MDQADDFEKQVLENEQAEDDMNESIKKYFGVDKYSMLSEKIEAIISEKTPEYIYPMVDEDLVDEELERLTIKELEGEEEAEEDDLEN